MTGGKPGSFSSLTQTRRSPAAQKGFSCSQGRCEAVEHLRRWDLVGFRPPGALWWFSHSHSLTSLWYLMFLTFEGEFVAYFGFFFFHIFTCMLLIWMSQIYVFIRIETRAGLKILIYVTQVILTSAFHLNVQRFQITTWLICWFLDEWMNLWTNSEHTVLWGCHSPDELQVKPNRYILIKFFKLNFEGTVSVNLKTFMLTFMIFRQHLLLNIYPEKQLG